MATRFFILLLIIISCKGSEKVGTNELTAKGDRTLFSVGDQSVGADEFKYVYSKNNGNNPDAFTKDDITEYLDLFIKFKLKIAEAKSRGMDTTEAYREELNTYLEQLKKPYLSENSVTDRLVREAYERYGSEVRASHLLLEIDELDTLKAYNKAMELRNRIMNGESFESVARKYSTDPSAKINGGDLGYFTSFQMVYPFETAAFNTPIGEVSMPIRTQFGYHLIYTKDKRPSNGKVQVAHIMLRHKPDSTEVRNQIFDIYDQATGGVAWEELVNQHSDDINSKRTKGILRPFSVGQMPIQFQEAAFALEETNQISDPIKTKYGWHILKLIKKEPVEAFEKMEPMISARISKDPRSKLNEKALIQRLKKENGFEEDLSTYNELRKMADSTLNAGNWKPDISSIAVKMLFSVSDIKYSVQQFVDFVRSKKKASSYSPTKYLDVLFENYKTAEIKAFEEANLEEKYVDYRMLLKEYKEGILLFNLMELEVWNKAVEDSIGLKNYFEANEGDYLWKERADVSIYSAQEAAFLEKIKAAIQIEDTTFLNKQNLYNTFNNGGKLNLQVQEGLYEQESVEVLARSSWKEGLHEMNYAGKNHLIWIKSIQPEEQKQLREARGAVISDYQTVLESNWIEKLKSKYTIEVDSTVLDNVYEELAKK